MDKQLQQLMTQADELRNGIHELADQSRNFEYNLTGIERCVETIQRCVRMVGNNRTAALPSRDQRKIMDELEGAANELQDLIKR
ncbi:hypothetical protein GCM10011348_05370 [Marinobacterium nitratireducens]|uniref:Uncharacterized protein n=1 Tax=Marinobacterium nitratireducens TaxID=518897 RepID=A0A917Z750_9GAMM|nr:hypothetical protein [Marinobacterium nitratireducens]GGO76951.1 hypothetical protein GCM10011348_05370 [Marinobacterium nitratireducens]